MTVISQQIIASADDARQSKFGPGPVLLAEPYVQIFSFALFSDVGGLRFVLDVPKDATIVSAIINAYVLASLFDSPRLDIKAEQADDPATFSAGDDLISRIPVGSPSVAWIESGLAGSDPNWVALPDIATVVQPIINRAGWDAGQHIVILLDGIAAGGATAVRFTSWDGDPTLAARMLITYALPVPYQPGMCWPKADCFSPSGGDVRVFLERGEGLVYVKEGEEVPAGLDRSLGGFVP